MVREAGACFSFVDFMSCITVAKQPCYGPLQISKLYYCSLICIKSVVYYGGAPTLMNAVLAIIANGGRAIIEINREVVEINYFLL